MRCYQYIELLWLHCSHGARANARVEESVDAHKGVCQCPQSKYYVLPFQVPVTGCAQE